MRSRLVYFFIFGLCLAAASRGLAGQPADGDVQEGIHALKAGDYSLAERTFQRVVERDPSALNFTYLAMSEAGGGKPERAITHFRKSIQLGSNSAAVHYNLGLAELRVRDVAEGVRELQHALSIDSSLKSALYTLAVTLLDAGRPEEAIPFLLRAREESPCDARIWANLARAQFEKGDARAALRTVDEAVEGMPTNVQLIVTLALICSRFHHFEKARYLLENANESLPEDKDVKLLLAKVSLQAKEPVEALAVLDGVSDDYGTPGEVPYVKGIALALEGQHKQAGTQFALAVSADPRNVRYLIAQAWASQLGGQHNEALTVLKQAETLDPGNPIIRFRQAASYFFLRQYPATTASCQEAIRLAPRYDTAFLLLGMASLEQGELASAEKAIGQAVALRPDSALYHRELGVALFKEGNVAGSKKELDQALSLDPRAVEAYYWRARVLDREGRQPEAIADLETVLALQPGMLDAYSELVQLYRKIGQPEKAQTILARQNELKATSEAEDRDHLLSDLTDPLL